MLFEYFESVVVMKNSVFLEENTMSRKREKERKEAIHVVNFVEAENKIKSVGNYEILLFRSSSSILNQTDY